MSSLQDNSLHPGEKHDVCFQNVLQFIREHRLFEEGDRVLVAHSGGLDSTVLLHLLSRMKQLLKIELMVAHVDHKTRGEASSQEGRWVQVSAERFGVDAIRLQLDGSTLKDQESLRKARRSLLLNFAKSQRLSKIVTAHHGDDNAETFLMRSLSGTGPFGLASMSPKSGPFVRPLLGISKAELHKYAALNRLGWVEDPSNARSDYMRNHLRNEVVPGLEKVRQGAMQNLSRLALRICQEEEEIEAWLLDRMGANGNTLRLAVLEDLPKPLQRRMLKLFVERFGFFQSPQMVEKLLAREDVLILQGCFVWRADHLVFSKEEQFGKTWEKPLLLELNQSFSLPNSLAWSYLKNKTGTEGALGMKFLLSFKPPLSRGIFLQKLAWDRVEWPLILRQPLKTEKWVSDLLTEAGIPEVFHSKWPLIAMQKDPARVLGVFGVRVLEPYGIVSQERCLGVELFFNEI